jgi:hypothetical protein
MATVLLQISIPWSVHTSRVFEPLLICLTITIKRSMEPLTRLIRGPTLFLPFTALQDPMRVNTHPPALCRRGTSIHLALYLRLPCSSNSHCLIMLLRDPADILTTIDNGLTVQCPMTHTMAIRITPFLVSLQCSTTSHKEKDVETCQRMPRRS